MKKLALLLLAGCAADPEPAPIEGDVLRVEGDRAWVTCGGFEGQELHVYGPPGRYATLTLVARIGHLWIGRISDGRVEPGDWVSSRAGAAHSPPALHESPPRSIEDP